MVNAKQTFVAGALLMKRLLLAAVPFAALGIGGLADAADLKPVYKAPPPPVAPVYNWTGFYVGAGGGYGMFNLDSSIRQNGNLVSDQQTLGGRGWFGTVVAGFDYQFSDRFVAGVFGDWDFSDIKGHWADPYWEESGPIKQRWAWSAGARLGYLIHPNVLSYVNGGFSEANFSRVNFFDFGLRNRPEPDFLPARTYSGWFVGGGLEAMVPGFPGWAVKTEYRFADYGAKNVPILNQPSAAFDRIHPFVQTVRTELTYKFGWGQGRMAADAPLKAYAADMPVKAVPRAAPLYNWTGLYLGAGGGYGMFNLDSSVTDNGNLVSDHQTLGGRGWFGTVAAGFDYQFSDRWVAGVFGDWDFSDIKGRWSDPWWERSGRIKERRAWSAGGRLGYLIYPSVLSYVSGGFTEAHFSSVRLFDFGLPSNPEPDVLAARTYSGWFLGGGMESMVPGFAGWFVKTEYRFADYGAKNVPILNQPDNAFARIHPFVQTVRTELSYKFNWMR